ncbi:hypothetical protein CARUB_v10018533mg [Capsella rubella]|uniref:F-box domain-containing protein n=1 Tax=Capsella rubella TaxID=81985 RepID=R0FS54_9BRAS|nr:putative F-box protein At3g44060 [Capsella rubella]EOA25221.1 hypothetical protein CARUB_v10018533mg [Capsella rubella]
MENSIGEQVVNPASSIDSLPDDLLVQILSFLPTKQAASTSAIAKRWRTLYTLVHNLHFDNLDYFYPENDEEYMNNIQYSFKDFVENTLALQGNNHIKKFSLKLFLTCDVHIVNRWICNVLEHGVSELYLDIKAMGWQRRLSSKVFTSTTLVKLSLGRGIYIPCVPSDACLPALKVLLLDSVGFKEIYDVLLPACPALEDFTIHQKYRHECQDILYKTIQTIKKLSTTNCSYNIYRSCTISHNKPDVVDHYFYGDDRHRSPKNNLNSLAKATMSLHCHVLWPGYINSIYLISGIHNVKTLHLTSSAVEVILLYYKDELPVFNNLVELAFSSKKRGWKMLLPLLLELSPNLKTLILSDLYRFTFGRRHRFVGLHIPPNNQIKMLHIIQYQGSETELKHISHFLLHMECLEVVKVCVAAEIDDLKKMQLTENMLKLPTVSSKLKIQVI